MKKEKTNKKNKGITLIALIITIIVMLILVGVTVGVALNGRLFNIAKTSTEQTQVEVDKEQLLSAVASAVGTDGKVDFDKLDEEIASDGSFTGTQGTYTNNKSGNKYTVNENGKIKIYDGTPLKLDNYIIVVGVDDTNKIIADCDYGEGTIEWLNSNEDVIKITANKNIAQIEAVGYGNAIITAKSGNYTANCEIMVPEINNSGIITHITAGTKNQLLKINELNEAEMLGTDSNYLGTIDITADIDMENVEWKPIYAPRLTINGNGNKISNLNCIQETRYGRSGFVGYGGGSTISNLTLENVTAIGTQVGAFIGYAIDGATLINCKLIGNNVISYQQNTGEYKEDYSGIGALIGMPCASSSSPSSATIEGNVTIKYNNMSTYCFEADETGALGFKVVSTTSLDFHNIDTTKATIIKEGTWTNK